MPDALAARPPRSAPPRSGQRPRKRRRAGGRWVYEAYAAHQGEQIFLGTRDTEEKAQRLIDDYAYKIRQREDKIARGESVTPLRGVTVREASEQWLEWLHNPDVPGHRSLRKYADQLRLHILPPLGSLQLDEVTPAIVRQWMTKLTMKEGRQLGREGRKLTPQTCNTVRICLSSLLTWCRKEMDWITSNPVASTKQLKPRARSFQWIHSMDDVTKLLAAVEHDDGRDFLALLVATGVRRGELLSLHWSDVNLELRTIHVCAGGRAKASPHEVKPTKSGENRTIPILDAALEILTSRKLRTGGQGFVFASPVHGGIRDEGTFEIIFQRAKKESGIERPGKPPIRLHDLRHTFAVHWVSSGGDIYALSKVLGHATVRTTEEYYAEYQVDSYRQHYHRVCFRLPASIAFNLIPLRAV